MEWQFVVALVLAIPVVLVPVALAWYLNVGGIHAAIREARQRRLAQGPPQPKVTVVTEEKELVGAGKR